MPITKRFMECSNRVTTECSDYQLHTVYACPSCFTRLEVEVLPFLVQIYIFNYMFTHDYPYVIQLAFVTADFPAIFGVLPLPRLRVSAPRNTTF
jgi:hypothetical protein